MQQTSVYCPWGLNPYGNWGNTIKEISCPEEWLHEYIMIGGIPLGKVEVDPPEYLWCTKGWENNCYHAKCVEAHPFGDGLTQYWATKGYKYVDKLRVVIQSPGSPIVSEWHIGHGTRVIQEYNTDTGNVYTRVDSYTFIGDDPWGYPIVSYKRTENGVVTSERANCNVTRGQFYSPWVVYYNVADYSLLNHFGEDTINTTQPTSVVEPYVGHGRPRMHSLQEDLSFESHPGLQEAVMKAYYEAVMNVGKLNDNNYQNAAEIISCLGKIIFGLKHGKLDLDLPKDWQSWWLWYRYAFTTTKLDAREGMNFIEKKFQALPRAYRRYYGTHKFDYAGDSIKVNCRVLVRESALNGPLEQVQKALWQYGFSPNLYVLWDSLPFSFMVDWAMPFGDVFGVLSNKKALEQWVDIKGVVFSVKYQHEYPDSIWEYYCRWNSVPLAIDEGFWFIKDGASAKTTVKRVLDTISIVTSSK